MMKASSSKDLPWDPNPSLSLPPIDKTTGWNPVNPGFHRLLTSPLSDSHGKWTGWVWGRDGLWPFRSDWRSACLLVELPATLPNTYVPTWEAGKKTGVDCCNAMVNIVLLNLSYSTVLGNPQAHWIHLEWRFSVDAMIVHLDTFSGCHDRISKWLQKWFR